VGIGNFLRLVLFSLSLSLRAKYFPLEPGYGVSMVITLRVGRAGFDSRQGQGIDFLLRHRIQAGPGAHPAS
jgi:hypothetical protein